jgi:hypothetical protein
MFRIISRAALLDTRLKTDLKTDDDDAEEDDAEEAEVDDEEDEEDEEATGPERKGADEGRINAGGATLPADVE